MTAPEPRPADDKTPEIIAASARPAGSEGQFDSETATTPPVRRRRIWRWLGGLLAALLALLLLALGGLWSWSLGARLLLRPQAGWARIVAALSCWSLALAGVLGAWVLLFYVW